MNSSVMNTYNRYPVSFREGNGAWLTSLDNKKFLDFSSGIAVNILGHNHPEINKTFEMQANKIWHVSNLYTIPEQELLAKKLCELSFAEKVFFCNSGAEAVEGAIKIARKFQSFKGSIERNEIITFKNSFHGRTLATLAAASNSLHTEGFNPIPDGFVNIPLDENILKKTISDKTAGILIEPVQGEGGINPDSNEFEIYAITAGENIEKLETQIAKYKPKYYDNLPKIDFNLSNSKLLDSEKIVSDKDVDFILFASSGSQAHIPIFKAIRSGKNIGLTNKEVIVTYGPIIMEDAKNFGSNIYPVDSEPSAIWQCIEGNNKDISKIILTASGGAFRDITI